MASYKEIFEENEHVILEMICGDVFEGNVTNVGESLFELINVRQHNNPNNLQGVYTFYRSEIERIFKLKKHNKNEKVDQKLFKISKLDKYEYDQLRIMSENYIYLENADSRYYKAVDDLENSETIVVVPLGTNKSLTTEIKLLGMCTKYHVYLFDLVHLQDRSFYPELKELLETKLICKVFHGGAACIDILFKNYKVYTLNIFDSQIADLVIEKNANGDPPTKTKSLAHCVKDYLKLPPSILKKSNDIKARNYFKRPLSTMEKLYASQMCTYLMKLHELIKKEMFRHVLQNVDNVHNYVHQLSDSDFEEYANSNKISQAVNNLITIQKKLENTKNLTKIPKVNISDNAKR